MSESIMPGILTGRLTLSIGCAQSRRLRQQTDDITIREGAKDGSMTVDARLWAGSKLVNNLTTGFSVAKRHIQNITLPWRRGEVIFRADRAQFVNARMDDQFVVLNHLIDEVVANYDAEVLAAVQHLGAAGNELDYPKDGPSFRAGVRMGFTVNTVSSSNSVAALVGGSLGQKMAADAEDALRAMMAEAQRTALLRMASAIRRIINACDEQFVIGQDGERNERKNFRMSKTILSDMQELAEAIPDLLIEQDENILAVAEEAKEKFRSFTREDLAKSPEAREKARQAARDVAAMLGGFGVGV